MKIIATLITSVVLFFSTSTENRQITVTLTNASSNKGKISFALYKKQGFLSQPIKSLNGIIEDGKSTIFFKNVEPGEYVIVCYHDSNNNDKMDFSPEGMPQENYGASNNVMSFGPPQYDNAKFEVTDKNVSLEIKFLDYKNEK